MTTNKIICYISLLIISLNSFAKDKLSKDLDNDGIKDQIIFDQKNSQIICKLSTQNFAVIKSKKLEDLGDTTGIESTKSGFQFYNHAMRSGYYCQFRYNTTEKKIQLIGMSRYSLGDALQNGSGESSVNLLTNKYIGDWVRFNQKTQKHVKIPTLKKSFTMVTTYLDGFSVKQPEYFTDFCDNLSSPYIYK